MFTWKTILAAMLYLQAPGKSIYSKVPAPEGSPPSIYAEVNGTKAYRLPQSDEDLPLQCQQEDNVACYRPRLRDVVFNGWNIRKEWQRIETYDEGVQRYAVIAQAIEDVVTDKEKKWSSPHGHLWRYLVAIAYHESGFRRDIHTGLGEAALGDCASFRRRGSREFSIVAGSCRSHGLFQTLFEHPETTKIFGFKAKQLIGDDLASTKRAVEVAVRHLERVIPGCASRGSSPSCVFAAYGGVRDAQDPRIQKRVGTFNKVAGAPTSLDGYVSNVLREKPPAPSANNNNNNR